VSRAAVVFQIGSLGDSIVSLPALRSLRGLLPDCDDYILVDRFDDALKVVPAEVFELVMKPKKRLNYRGQAAKSRLGRMWSVASLSTQLQYYRPHYGVYLMPSDRTEVQVTRDRTFFRSMGVKELLGFRTLNEHDRAEDHCPSQQCSEAYLRLRRLWNGQTDEQFATHARTPMFEPTGAAGGHVEEWLRANRRFPERLLVAVSPFSNCSSKDLSLGTTAELIKKLEDEARVETVLVGGPKDTAPATSVVERSGAGLNGCGIFSLGETAALLQKCRMAIAVDSGPMHLAAAVGTRAVVVYSRTNAHLDRWFPLGTGHTILYRETACAGCGEQVCPVSDHPCIDGISVDEIFGAALHTLGLSPLPESRNGTRMLTL
jgi:heptosyltransferase-3